MLRARRYLLMTDRVELLEWDSEFFGFPIGRTDLGGLSAVELAELDQEARDKGIDCLYGSLDPADCESTYHAQVAGHRLVEIGITFRRPAVPFSPRATKATVREATIDDLADLDAAVAVLAPWSRFGADPRFGPDAARRMHGAWVERAARDDDRMLSIAEDASGVVGVAAQVRSEIPRIDFMGVTKPGAGASWALMGEFFDWAGGGVTDAGPCAARNIAVLRFVEHCGFAAAQVRYRFHRWLDESPGGSASP